MTTYVINPITDELESAQPKQTVGNKFKLQTFVRDQFALGGGVIQGEKIGNRENFQDPKQYTRSVKRPVKYSKNLQKLIDKFKKTLPGTGILFDVERLDDPTRTPLIRVRHKIKKDGVARTTGSKILI